METVTTEQGNNIIDELELVREFMGYELKQGKELARFISGGNAWYVVGENFTVDEPSWLPHENWNHLMPVVHKIMDISDIENVTKDELDNAKCGIAKYHIGTDISDVWLATIDFLTYLNKMK